VLLFLPETMQPHPNATITSSQGVGGEAGEGECAALEPKRGASAVELIRTDGVAAALMAYFFLSFIDMSFNEIVPLWAMSSLAVGGLNMLQKSIAALMTLTGCLLVVYTFVLFPKISNYFGRVRSYRGGQIIFIPFCLGLTLLSAIPQDSFMNSLQFPLLVLFYAVGKACCSLGNSSLGLIINRSVPKEKRASINGLSMSIGSASKAIGPMSSAFIYAWSISSSNTLPFPFDYHLIYIILALIACLCACLPIDYHEDTTDAPDSSTTKRTDVEMSSTSSSMEKTKYSKLQDADTDGGNIGTSTSLLGGNRMDDDSGRGVSNYGSLK
jgi:hypothetical protein